MTSLPLDALPALSGVPVYVGYPPTGAVLPYICIRPLDMGPTNAIAGCALFWDTHFSVYACTNSVNSCYSLSTDLLSLYHGAIVDGVAISASFSYMGAEIEGHYETLITLQFDKGEDN